MERLSSRSMINEVYTQIIQVTVEGVEKYLKNSKRYFSKFDIAQELQSRWQARINCLFFFLESSWAKFQEIRSKAPENSKKMEFFSTSSPVFNFPLVCNLSFDFFQNFYSTKESISGFKSWIWNCLITQVITEGVCPFQAKAKKNKTKKLLKENKIFFEEKSYKQHGKNIFNNYRIFLDQGLNFYFNSENNLLIDQKKIHFNKKNSSIIIHSESLGSELDDNLESQISDEIEDKIPNCFIIAMIEKVHRKSAKWKIVLKDGILHLNEKDFLFNICKCEFFW
jgi:hypothetical protein